MDPNSVRRWRKVRYVQVFYSLVYKNSFTKEGEVIPTRQVQEIKKTKCQIIGLNFYHVCTSHLGLIVLLLLYTFMGGAIFRAIEGHQIGATDEQKLEMNRDYVIADILSRINSSSNNSALFDFDAVRDIIQTGFLDFTERIKSDGLMDISPKAEERWDYWCAVNYCVSVYTTIGYGDLYPETIAGRWVTILYATLGIPLCLITLADLGLSFSKGLKYIYRKIRQRWCKSCYRKQIKSAGVNQSEKGQNSVNKSGVNLPEKESNNVNKSGVNLPEKESNNVNKFDITLPEKEQKIPLSSDVDDNNKQNRETVLTVIDKLKQNSGTSSSSAPLNSHMLVNEKATRIIQHCLTIKDSEDTSVRDDKEEDPHSYVPMLLPVLITLLYILLGVLLYSQYEGWDFTEAFYFTFISLSTIGFGDYVPREKYFILSTSYHFLGLALVAMTVTFLMELTNATLGKAKHKVDILAGKKFGLNIVGSSSKCGSNDSLPNKQKGFRTTVTPLQNRKIKTQLSQYI